MITCISHYNPREFMTPTLIYLRYGGGGGGGGGGKGYMLYDAN